MEPKKHHRSKKYLISVVYQFIKVFKVSGNLVYAEMIDQKINKKIRKE